MGILDSVRSALGLAGAGGQSMLGQPGDPIRAFLFANQSLEELLGHVKTDGKPADSVWADMAAARAAFAKGQQADAVARLRSALGRADLESRIRLWIWTALRGAGVAPDPEDARIVRGVVLEVPVPGGIDILAAYDDGTARYINYSGKSVFWEATEEKISGLCRALLQDAQQSEAQAAPKHDYAPPTGQAPQMALLTYAGNKTAAAPNSTLGCGAELMNELVERAMRSRQPAQG